MCCQRYYIELEVKDVSAAALIKKRCYRPKVVPDDLINTNFEDKEVDDVGIIEAINEDNKLFKLFCVKDPDYAMNVMANWMALIELEGARTRRNFTDNSGTKETKKFAYRQIFGIPFRYRHQVDDHNNQIHAPNSL